MFKKPCTLVDVALILKSGFAAITIQNLPISLSNFQEGWKSHKNPRKIPKKKQTDEFETFFIFTSYS